MLGGGSPRNALHLPLAVMLGDSHRRKTTVPPRIINHQIQKAMETQEPKRINLKDCKIDWKNHPAEDENGNPTIEDWTEHREQWLRDDCECNEYSLANRDCCYLYYKFDYDPEKFEQWRQQNNYSKNLIAYWGLCRMFDDGWIKSPAFVDWRHFEGVLDSIGLYIFFRSSDTESFIREFNNPDDRVAILKHFIDNIRYIIKDKDAKKYMLPVFRNLLNIQQEALKLHKEALKQQEKAEKAKNKITKEKPEYILSLDEIVKYVLDENPDSAHVIRAMLRFFAMEKQGWATATVKSKIDQIKQQIIVQQTNINAPISNFAQEQHIDNLTTK